MEGNANNNMQIGDNQPAVAQISAKEFAAKFQSKRECYVFLAVENNVYLPPIDNVTIYFVSKLQTQNIQHFLYSSRT